MEDKRARLGWREQVEEKTQIIAKYGKLEGNGRLDK